MPELDQAKRQATSQQLEPGAAAPSPPKAAELGAAERGASASTPPRAAAGLDDIISVRRRFIEAARRAELIALINATVSETELGRNFCEELSDIFQAEIAFVLEQRSGPRSWRMIGSLGVDPDRAASLADSSPIVAAGSGAGTVTLDDGDWLGLGAEAAMVTPFIACDGRVVFAGVARTYPEPFSLTDRNLLEVVTLNLGQALERISAFEDRARQAEQHASLLRASKSMAAAQRTDEVIATLCTEAARTFAGSSVCAGLGDDIDGFEIRGAAGHGVEGSVGGHEADGLVGARMAAGTGLGGRAVRAGIAMSTHAYQEEGYAPPEAPPIYAEIRTAMAVPVRWDGRVRGFVSVCFTTQRSISDQDVELLEGFTEVAGLACANTERLAGLRKAAELDAITGCYNRLAFDRRLKQLCDHGGSVDEPLSLVLIDLDGFKSINAAYGHPAGDKALKQIAAAILHAVRAQDVVARFGGDEFALILPSVERAAIPVLDRVRTAIAALDLPGGGMTASFGLAERNAGDESSSLIERADLALRAAMQGSAAGSVRRARRTMLPEPAGLDLKVEVARHADRRHALAGQIGLAIARQLEVPAAAAAAADELGEALEMSCCAVLRFERGSRLCPEAVFGRARMPSAWIDSTEEVVIQALRQKRAVLIDPSGSTFAVTGDGAEKAGTRGRELIVPMSIEGRVWGAIVCLTGDAVRGFDHHDAELVMTVAAHLSASIRAAELFDRLSRSMIGTAEALAAALEAKDSYTAEHAHAISELAMAVGMELGLSEPAIEDLRYGGIFHDIGKIAVPDALLNKPGALTEAEFELVKSHSIVGAEIIAPIPALAGACSIVRHAHEHWDGNGYPDGLRGEQIPLGARIVHVVDAFHAMTSDRPYRRAMPAADAFAELSSNAGSQFDPDVVETLLRVLRGRGVEADA